MKPTFVNGWPSARWMENEIVFNWKANLETVLSIGTNNFAMQSLSRLGVRSGISHLTIASPGDHHLLKKAACQNRHALHSTHVMSSIPRDKMEEELPWMKPQGMFSTGSQLDTESLWKLLLWAAEQHKPGQDPAQTLLEDFNRKPGDFGIITRSAAERVRETYQELSDQYGWHHPRQSGLDKVAVLQAPGKERRLRLLIVLNQEGWQAWRIGRPSSILPGIPIHMAKQGENIQDLLLWLRQSILGKTIWRNKAFRVDPIAGISAPFGVPVRDNDLKGYLQIGRLTEDLMHLSPNQRQYGIDYENSHVLHERALEQQIDPEQSSEDIRFALAQKALEQCQQVPAGWRKRISCDLDPAASVCTDLAELEALSCYKLSSGMVQSQLPAQPHRLQGRIEPCSIYQPLNPFLPAGE